MRLGQSFDAGNELVDARVVLHGARPERVHAEIDGVIPGGEPREVTDDFDLAQFGQKSQRATVSLAKQRFRVNGRHVKRGQLVGTLARRGLLEEQRLILRRVGTDFAEGVGAGILRSCHSKVSFRTIESARTISQWSTAVYCCGHGIFHRTCATYRGRRRIHPEARLSTQ